MRGHFEVKITGEDQEECLSRVREPVMGDETDGRLRALKKTRRDRWLRGGVLQKSHKKEKTEAKLGVRNIQVQTSL